MPPAPHQLDHRTRLLINPGNYLQAAHTRTLTGHSPRALTQQVERGEIRTRDLGRTTVYPIDSVLDYCRRQPEPLTLVDALRDAADDGDHLTDEEVDRDLARTGSGTRWTLARRDHEPPTWPTWNSWFRGETATAQQHMWEQRTRWTQQVRDHRSRGLVRRTLWVTPEPLTPFGEYSLARYHHVVAAGGSVHTLPARRVARLEDQQMLPDLEVTPGAIYVRLHSRGGSRDGAVRVRDLGLVAATRSFLAWAARQHGTPLTEAPHHKAAA